MKFHITVVLRRLMVFLIFMAVTCTAWSAPVVVVPGEGAGYVYYSAGGGSTPATPAEDDSNVGMVAAFFFTPPTDTWVVCNGQTISAATYPKLVLALTGSAAATSAVMPNLQGYFLRGVNTGASGVDPGRTVGSTQGDAFQGHWHDFYVGRTSSAWDHLNTEKQIALADSAGGRWLQSAQPTTDIINYPKTDGANGAPRTSTETRPVNIAVIYAMRAK